MQCGQVLYLDKNNGNNLTKVEALPVCAMKSEIVIQIGRAHV